MSACYASAWMRNMLKKNARKFTETQDQIEPNDRSNKMHGAYICASDAGTGEKRDHVYNLCERARLPSTHHYRSTHVPSAPVIVFIVSTALSDTVIIVTCHHSRPPGASLQPSAPILLGRPIPPMYILAMDRVVKNSWSTSYTMTSRSPRTSLFTDLLRVLD